MFAALGDETRLRLVSRLCHEGPLCIVRLSAPKVTRAPPLEYRARATRSANGLDW